MSTHRQNIAGAEQALGMSFSGFEPISVAMGAAGEASTFAYCGEAGELEVSKLDGTTTYRFRTWADLGYQEA